MHRGLDGCVLPDLLAWSKMAMGMDRVQQALGTSTMPAMRPSQGQQLSRRMICAHSSLRTALSSMLKLCGNYNSDAC